MCQPLRIRHLNASSLMTSPHRWWSHKRTSRSGDFDGTKCSRLPPGKSTAASTKLSVLPFSSGRFQRALATTKMRAGLISGNSSRDELNPIPKGSPPSCFRRSIRPSTPVGKRTSSRRIHGLFDWVLQTNQTELVQPRSPVVLTVESIVTSSLLQRPALFRADKVPSGGPTVRQARSE